MGTERGLYPDIEERRDSIGNLIREAGTPVAVCDKSILTARFETLQGCLTKSWPSTQIAYSFKTNYEVAKSGIFKELGAFAEVVSGREYALARELGYPGSEIIFNGPYKDDESLRSAIDERAVINVNDQQELRRIIEIANLRRELVPVGIRVSSTLEGFGHSRFGFSMENGEAKSMPLNMLSSCVLWASIPMCTVIRTMRKSMPSPRPERQSSRESMLEISAKGSGFLTWEADSRPIHRNPIVVKPGIQKTSGFMSA